MSESTSDQVLVDRQYDWEQTVPSVAVIEALASSEDATPGTFAAELDTTLYDHINTDALDTLVTGGTDVTLSFSVASYRVRIAGERLTVTRDGSASGRV